MSINDTDNADNLSITSEVRAHEDNTISLDFQVHREQPGNVTTAHILALIQHLLKQLSKHHADVTEMLRDYAPAGRTREMEHAYLMLHLCAYAVTRELCDPDLDPLFLLECKARVAQLRLDYDREKAALLN